MSGSSTAPTLAGFNTFLYTVVGISPIILPTTAPVIAYCYNVAISIVNTALAVVPGNIYALAVYNLGASQVIHFAPDVPGYQDDPNSFTQMRKNFGIGKFTPGVVASTADSSTSTSLLNPEFMKTLTLQNLQNIKDPWGRQYLAFAQSYGPTIWGLT